MYCKTKRAKDVGQLQENKMGFLYILRGKTMKCKDCKACKKGWFPSDPDEYVCIGVKEPFAINDINAECTEYEDKRKMTAKEYVCRNFTKEEIIKQIINSSIISPCIEDFGIKTELSNICSGNCEECWNSRVIERL